MLSLFVYGLFSSWVGETYQKINIVSVGALYVWNIVCSFYIYLIIYYFHDSINLSRLLHMFILFSVSMTIFPVKYMTCTFNYRRPLEDLLFLHWVRIFWVWYTRWYTDHLMVKTRKILSHRIYHHRSWTFLVYRDQFLADSDKVTDTRGLDPRLRHRTICITVLVHL